MKVFGLLVIRQSRMEMVPASDGRAGWVPVELISTHTCLGAGWLILDLTLDRLKPILGATFLRYSPAHFLERANRLASGHPTISTALIPA